MGLYNRDEFEKRMAELEEIEDKESDFYFYKYMKVILSFGKIDRLTERGIETGKKYYERWKNGEELTREEIIDLGFLLSDICVIEGNKDLEGDLEKIYDQTITAYKPDFGYMQESAKALLKKGYIERNPNYMETIYQMFLQDCVLSDPEQVKMINTGEMPLYDDIQSCPYCNKPFDEVEDLFKHVKENHKKK